MFSLLLGFTAILLVAALVLATVYYGGSSFRQGGASATAVQLVAEGTQISAAVDLYRTEQSQAPASLAQLVSANYLKALPSANWVLTDLYVTAGSDVTEAQCLEVNKVHGLSSIPSCSDQAYRQRTVCCSDA